MTDHPVRAAGAGEVRIAVKAAAVNPTDILMRKNPEVYAKGSPGIPGMDAAGVIESVGERPVKRSRSAAGRGCWRTT